MPSFVPQVQPYGLPAIGAAIERATKDWKLDSAATDFEKAKDVAAFANHLGGTIILGAKEVDGHLAVYRGVLAADAGAIRQAYDDAVRGRCEPKPHIDFDEYDDPNDVSKRIVVVNVWPSLNLVGVKVSAHKPAEGWAGIHSCFPSVPEFQPTS